MFNSPTGSIYVAGDTWFWDVRREMVEDLLNSPLFHGRMWQQLDVGQSDSHATHELLNATLWYDMPDNRGDAQRAIEPDLPWAEAHFQERVGGEPINPGVEHANWPYHGNGYDLHLREGGKYDHNYMERFWCTQLSMDDGWAHEIAFSGYRFPVGDLGDVVDQLKKDPTTRQAYLPVWFPEDTGATSRQRVPCTLGYHFIVRDGKMHLQYNIRSCDVYRHFTNDVYMAVRLGQWMRDKVDRTLGMGQLTMHVVSFHAFKGDVLKIREKML